MARAGGPGATSRRHGAGEEEAPGPADEARAGGVGPLAGGVGPLVGGPIARPGPGGSTSCDYIKGKQTIILKDVHVQSSPPIKELQYYIRVILSSNFLET